MGEWNRILPSPRMHSAIERTFYLPIGGRLAFASPLSSFFVHISSDDRVNIEGGREVWISTLALFRTKERAVSSIIILSSIKAKKTAYDL